MKGRKEDEAVEGRDEGRYGEELLCANWNPVIDLLAASCARTASQSARSEAEALREEDAAAFLGRIYTLG
ncbi:MAG TPA: hypothetical protein VED01_08625 [Burkholderiales bacterium]|nr:hypothetical protein [Burkholderiales bacterium]